MFTLSGQVETVVNAFTILTILSVRKETENIYGETRTMAYCDSLIHGNYTGARHCSTVWLFKETDFTDSR
jgi:hypothetical protein